MKDQLAKKAKETGRIPKFLENKPELFSDLQWIMDSYDEMHRGRSYSFDGPQRISYKDISSYLDFISLELSNDELDRFKKLIYEMDHEYFNWVEFVRKTKAKDKAKR